MASQMVARPAHEFVETKIERQPLNTGANENKVWLDRQKRVSMTRFASNEGGEWRANRKQGLHLPLKAPPQTRVQGARGETANG